MSAKIFAILFVFLVVLAIYGNVYACKSTCEQQFESCREGWFRHGKKCLKFFIERKTWRKASDSCAAEGGHLATVPSKDVQDFIVEYFMNDGKPATWIGLNDLKDQGNYVWQDGAEVTYTNWGPGEPSSPNERCVEIVHGDIHKIPQPKWGYMGMWNDAPCEYDRPYICQVDACEVPSPLPVDCEDVLRNGNNQNGVYKIFPLSRAVPNAIEVYCDMITDGGGWTVIQRRGDFHRQNDYFFQDWQAYQKGFGDIEKDFWLGNDNIFGLSNQRMYSVRFDLKDVDEYQRFALYDTFWIDDEQHKYTLHINDYRGDAGDSMIEHHNGQKFSTKDQRNDNSPHHYRACAEEYKGGWWYNQCHTSNLNGLYLRGKHETFGDGVIWNTWRGYYESLEWTEIKIRSKDFRK